MKNELIKGGLIMFILSSIVNVINYLFQMSMGRLLSVENYGVLVVLTSFITYFAIAGGSISTTLSRYTSKFFSNKGKIKDLIYRTLNKSLKVSFILYLLFIPVAIFFSYFLKIPFMLLAITGVYLFATFTSPATKGVLQGQKRFKSLGFSSIFEALTKLLVAIVLVLLIKNVYGAVIAILFGAGFGIAITMYMLRDVIGVKREHTEVKGIYSYNWKAFILFISLTLIFSLDVILARRFFLPEIAGKYAVISMISKIIYFSTSAIAIAMFPILSLKEKKDKKRIFHKSLFIIISMCFVGLLAFLFFPELIITILFGSKYLGISNILFFVGLALSIRSVTNLNILNKLAGGEIKNSWVMFIFTITSIVILLLFHQSVIRFAIALIFSDITMFIGTLFLKTKEIK